MAQAPAFETKLCPPAELDRRLNRLSRPLVFTNGVFDILHRGHVTYLAQARALGASLVVAVNSDASARTLEKGQDRPVNGLGDRAALVAALESVTLVTWFDQDTPLELIRWVKPDVLVKGGDWTVDRIVGADLVLARRGTVKSLRFAPGYSTTELVNRMRTTEAHRGTRRNK